MKLNMATANRVLVTIYAASPAVLTLLVDAKVMPIHIAADVGVIVTTFAAAWHGSQGVAVLSSKPTAP